LYTGTTFRASQYRLKAESFTAENPFMISPDLMVADHQRSDERYRGPRRNASTAILLSKDFASKTGEPNNWFHPNQTGITLSAPADENLTARSGSTRAGEERNSWDVTSEAPQSMKEEAARDTTGCLNNMEFEKTKIRKFTQKK
jgi:hypothetical protein